MTMKIIIIVTLICQQHGYSPEADSVVTESDSLTYVIDAQY